MALHQRVLCVPLCITVLLSTHNLYGEADPLELGRQIAERECEGCHGVDGISSVSTTPSIGGFSETAILDLLESYRQETRPAQSVVLDDGTERDMYDVIKQVPLTDLQHVASYYDSLRWTPHEQLFDKDLAQRGKRIHKVKCGKCHLKEGSIPESDHAILMGQWRAYIAQQFDDFDSRKRRMASKMQQKYDSLSAEDKLALKELYASGGKL